MGLKKTLICILTTFCWNVIVIGQNRQKHIEGYSSVWYESQMILRSQLDLVNISETQNNKYFRLWTDHQVIDLWENENNQMFGKITCWTQEVISPAGDTSKNIWFKSRKLGKSKLVSILEIIDSSRINYIPDQEFIKGWELGCDGITYLIEMANKNDYYFKAYWTPIAQDSLREAVIVQNFVDKVLILTNADKIWGKFVPTIPYDCYTNGMIVFCNN